MIYQADLFYLKYRICKITYTEHSSESFEYVFEPDYDIIDSLNGFRGIPGIDLSLHKDRYVRENILPTLLGERLQLPNKHPFHRAMIVNGMCPLEYLTHCRYDYFGDNLAIKAPTG